MPRTACAPREEQSLRRVSSGLLSMSSKLGVDQLLVAYIVAVLVMGHCPDKSIQELYI